MASKLGEFIRMRREQIKPEDVGIVSYGRRRTPGLRREELAQLCGVSSTWLTWLEQGRPVAPSVKVLDKLACLLNLTAPERAYLFKLADKLDPAQLDPPTVNEDADRLDFDAVVRAIKTPAYIINRRWDAVAWNGGARDLLVGWLDDAKPRSSDAGPNLLAYIFLSKEARKLIDDWNHRAQRVVAEFRADCGRHADQEPLASLIHTLSEASMEFRQLWRSQQVVSREGGTRTFLHPVKGALSFEQITFTLAAHSGTKLVMLLPR
jgi:transcriptional regulator with XRE-family HTH domain